MLDYEDGLDADAYFLDIQMKGTNGMQCAREIHQKDPKALIVFITAIKDYVFEGYDVDALGYILKPYEQDQIDRMSVSPIRAQTGLFCRIFPLRCTPAKSWRWSASTAPARRRSSNCCADCICRLPAPSPTTVSRPAALIRICSAASSRRCFRIPLCSPMRSGAM